MERRHRHNDHLQEVWRNRGRFFLLSLVIALITLLVLFIAALGEGLANGNRQYIANLDAQLIVFREKSDTIIPSSRLDNSTLRAVRRVSGVASAGAIYTASSEIVSTGKPIKISLLGADPDYPGMPAVVKGKSFRGGDSNEVVIDRNLSMRSGLGIGDKIEIRSTQGPEDKFSELAVVGLTEGQSYLFQPTIFVAPTTWERIRPQSEAELNFADATANVIAVRLVDPQAMDSVRTEIQNKVENVQVATLKDAIQALPGYSAQQSTLNTQGTPWATSWWTGSARRSTRSPGSPVATPSPSG